jgi:hypothetical protein
MRVAKVKNQLRSYVSPNNESTSHETFANVFQSEADNPPTRPQFAEVKRRV